MKFGYALAGEEHAPVDLVRNAVRAEEAGFEFAMVSDHFHPWVGAQGQSPFVWCVIGGIAQATSTIRLGTGVTCPLIRIHPVIVAQAAATAAAMMPGRFFLGLGAGENLNEHVVGQGWPEPAVRLEMFEEAVEVIQKLWQGEYTSHHGRYYTVDEAKLFTLPEQLPPLCMAADGPLVAERAGRIADGLIAVAPKAELVERFDAGGAGNRPHYGQITVCWAESKEEARQIAFENWPTSGLEGNLSWETKTPKLFEDAVKTLRVEDVAKSILCGPDTAPYVDKVGEFADAGFDHLCFHHVGKDQAGFFEFYEKELSPALAEEFGKQKRRRTRAR